MFGYINKLIEKLKKDEKGQGMVEYALIIAFVAAIAIFVLNGQLKTSVNGAFTGASSAVTDATTEANNLVDDSKTSNASQNP